MPSSLVAGMLHKLLRVSRRLTIQSTGILVLEPRSAPTGDDAVKGAVYLGTDGKLYVHNGTAFVVAGSQA
jgi:hypothetical protein